MNTLSSLPSDAPDKSSAALEGAVEKVLRAARSQMALYDTAGWEAAVSILIGLLQRLPDCALAHAALAECYAHWGFRRELDGLEAPTYYALSVEQAEQAVRLAPEAAASHRALAAALARGERADPVRRKEEALVALDLDPRDAANWYEYWRAFGYKLDDPAVMRALELDPHLVGAAIDLGVAFCEAGRLAEAERLLAHALRDAPGNTLARYDLAMVLARERRAAEARAGIEEALSADPGNPLLLEGLAILNAEGRPGPGGGRG